MQANLKWTPNIPSNNSKIEYNVVLNKIKPHLSYLEGETQPPNANTVWTAMGQLKNVDLHSSQRPTMEEHGCLGSLGAAERRNEEEWWRGWSLFVRVLRKGILGSSKFSLACTNQFLDCPYKRLANSKPWLAYSQTLKNTRAFTWQKLHCLAWWKGSELLQ